MIRTETVEETAHSLMTKAGIEIPDDAAETIQTVGDAVKFISEKSA